MEDCSRQCIRRALHAVLMGISPILICLFAIGFIRIIIYFLEVVIFRNFKTHERRRSSSNYYQNGRSTLLYTPVSISELQRIIRGDYHSQQATESSLSSAPNNETETHKGPKFIKSILSKRESPPPVPSGALANLIGRRHAINAIPFTALFVPVSTPSTPKIDMINEKKTRRPSVSLTKHESIEKSSTKALNRNNCSFEIYESTQSEIAETQPLCSSQMRTLSATASLVIEEETHEYYSTTSIPYVFN